MPPAVMAAKRTIIGIAEGSGTFYAGLTLMGIGSALAIPTMTSLVSLFAPPERQGKTLGIFRSVGALARDIGPIAGALIYWRFGHAAPYLASAAIMLIFMIWDRHGENIARIRAGTEPKIGAK